MAELNEGQKNIRRLLAIREIKPKVLTALEVCERASKENYFDTNDNNNVLHPLYSIKEYLERAEKKLMNIK